MFNFEVSEFGSTCKRNTLLSIVILVALLTVDISASKIEDKTNRQAKFLSFPATGNDFLQGRTRPVTDGFNSPVYYIRLPPMPYTFVPGFGYMSQPSTPSLLNLPLPFLGNGKPVTIYQWHNTIGNPFASTASGSPAKVNHIKDTEIHRLNGHFAFNGKPNDIHILRDQYNSLYDDSLQNLYP